jgi:hypothetical protein
VAAPLPAGARTVSFAPVTARFFRFTVLTQAAAATAPGGARAMGGGAPASAGAGGRAGGQQVPGPGQGGAAPLNAGRRIRPLRRRASTASKRRRPYLNSGVASATPSSP